MNDLRHFHDEGLSPAAHAALAALRAEEDEMPAAARALRLAVRKTGCSGFAYVVNYAEDVSPKDARPGDPPAGLVQVEDAAGGEEEAEGIPVGVPRIGRPVGRPARTGAGTATGAGRGSGGRGPPRG